MPTAENERLTERITEMGERVVDGTGIEIVEISLRGAGKARLVRVYIDKTGGVTHGDCELVSERLGHLLDEHDVIPGDSYTLEVSSPGVERKLSKPRDFERARGQMVKIVLRQAIEGLTRLEGKLVEVADEALFIETAPDGVIRVPLGQVQKANLKFEWK